MKDNFEKIELSNKYESFLSQNKKNNPWKESLKIMILYLVIGILWILLSDKIVNLVWKNHDIIAKIQLYKGWFYVAATTLVFFIIIKDKLKLFKNAEEGLLESYSELINLNEALKKSEQKYKLAVEGVNDGIWDWDIEENTFFFSLKNKKGFEYLDEEIENSIEAWQSLFHSEDKSDAYKKIIDYLYRVKEGTYENTYRIRAKSGEYRWIQSKGKGVWDKDGKPLRVSGSHTDITDLREMQEKLKFLAYYDKLTGLPNRALFESEFNNLVKKNKEAVVVNIDIDNFRHINSTMGYEVGDFCIKHIKDILEETIKAPDIIAKTGGEQFAIIFSGDVSRYVIINKIEFLLKKIRSPINYKRQTIFVTVSMGVSYYPEHGKTFDKIMQSAETAMFHKKEIGKDGYSIYEEKMYEKALKFVKMSSDLKRAIKNEEFVLYYQPEVELGTNSMKSVEALIRWQQKDGDFIPPIDFIPFSEQTGHIFEITKWVVKKSVLQRREWAKKGLGIEKIAVNLSGYIVTDDYAIAEIIDLLKSMDLKANELEIEVTETSIMMDLEKAKENLFKLRDIGVSIALDDFGTGYSSLTYLNNLPLDMLKMDREFIKKIKMKNEEDQIYFAIINLAHNMGLKVLAEGVEIPEQKDFLEKNQCDMAQGYYFCKPLPASKLEEIL